jgi:hypothetical protein
MAGRPAGGAVFYSGDDDVIDHVEALRIWLSLISVLGVLYLIWPPLFFLAVVILFAAFAIGTHAAFDGYRGS